MFHIKKIDYLSLFSLIYLALPLVIFFIGYLKIIFAIPLTVLVIISVILSSRSGYKITISFSPKIIVVVNSVAFV